ncbi:unnamed protein product [Adineta steineri]|uniref:Uncharacterized protein n=1 Tax=Adineta steineri TaxID=433720 RepID=A0A819FDW7_9BILA|nr:unnamed protein product [Adineta steineri]CAF3866454.1 unnamed protein product [Adineta steineri]
MVKNEQPRNINSTIRTTPSAPIPPPPPRPQPPPPPPTQLITPMFSTAVLSHRLIDPNAIDITSLKGQFAWEKVPQSDTYVPVIFRGDTKYFCVRMLRKILPEYPEDIIRRAYQYQYRKTIDLYSVTACEVELLNRINSQHSRWAFSRQPFTALDEIVRVSDFIPFYEYLRHGTKSTSAVSNVTVHTLRQLLPQPQQTVQRASENVINMPAIIQRQITIPQPIPAQIQSYTPPTNFTRETISSTSRPIAPTHNVRQSKSIGNPYAVLLPSRLPQQIPLQIQSSVPSSINNTMAKASDRVLSTTSNVTPVSVLSSVNSSSTSLSPAVLSSINNSPPASTSPVVPQPSTTSMATNINRKPSTASIPSSLSINGNRKPSTSSISPSPSSSSSTTTTNSLSSLSKASSLHCGWLQINKLYTPYISTSAKNHLYKLPVSLLTFYDLLKVPSAETNDSPNEPLLPFEQTNASPQELELINELCIKQHIRPFGTDTKLIELSTFYQYTAANILFVKELPNEEPKSSICKEWASIVQTNGGICLLRNISTLQEQTVPFIGNNLLKNFILSTHCLSTASVSKPTSSELEFLQLILFFSNMSINLRNAQLIDIESVRKEYNVDLILLFNDKFPLNVLNYQQGGSRSNSSQGSVKSTNPTAPTNTIAESTPPPSPPSPPTNQPQSTSTSQLPLTPTTNRFHKTIEFHGHTLTAYICSGLGANTQRECVSIRSLCNILCPNSTSPDKLEVKMLPLLRSKNINRFRPQNQQPLGVTRLIDIQDAEKHWTYIEQEMHSIFNDNEKTNIQTNTSPISNENSKASTVVVAERVENDEQPLLEPSIEINKGEKRSLEEPLDEEDIPVLERLNKRVRFAEKENNEQINETLKTSTCSVSNGKTKTDDKLSPKKRTIKITKRNTKKRLLPSSRTNRQTRAKWVKKYNIEDCCIQLIQYDPVYDTEKD